MPDHPVHGVAAYRGTPTVHIIQEFRWTPYAIAGDDVIREVFVDFVADFDTGSFPSGLIRAVKIVVLR